MNTRRRSRDVDLQITDKQEATSGVHSKVKVSKQKKSAKKQKDSKQDILNLETPSKQASVKKPAGKSKKTKAIKKNKPAPKGKK